MKSSKIFDDVIIYLEKLAYEDSDIDYNEISRIVMCPIALFQRIFIFVSGISISDYVRKRRLTIAGNELRNSDISVLDIAIKYGFQSHSAFTRAFKDQHGITPSQARQLTTKLNDYLPINFSDMRFIGGKRIMAEMKKIIYKQADERLMVGMFAKPLFKTMGKHGNHFLKETSLKNSISCQMLSVVMT